VFSEDHFDDGHAAGVAVCGRDDIAAVDQRSGATVDPAFGDQRQGDQMS
jgi:hypothetical protein